MKPKFSKRDRRDKDAPPKVRRAPGTPTKSQLRAAAPVTVHVAAPAATETAA